MKNINSIFITSLTLILISIVIILFLIKPAYQKFNFNKTQLKESEAELQYRRDYIKQIAAIKKRLDEDKDAVAKIDFALPTDVSIASLFNFLQTAAQKNGLLLADVTMPTKVSLVLHKKATAQNGKSIIQKRKTNLDYYSFTTQVRGPYEHSKRFISDVEKSARMVEIDDVDFSHSIRSSTSDDFSCNLALKIYSFHQ